ncbi:chemotaxis protein CheW [Undibacterium flavidum]
MKRANKEMETTAEVSQFLAFTLGDEEYGLALLQVQELREYEKVTQIANAPAFLKGVINLRGIIVPIMDLRIKLNLANITYNELTVVIILNIRGRTVGMVVDSVSDVISLNLRDMKPAPEMGTTVGTDYLTGLGIIDERMIILVDIERMLSSSEIGLLEQTAA